MAAAVTAAKGDALLEALLTELSRSYTHLKMDQVQAPYYIEYAVTDQEEYAADASGQRWHANNLSVAYALLRITLGLKFKDTQCGFKAFRQPAVQAIFPLQQIERWGFDPETLFLARKFKFKVQEIPVAWGHSGGTRIHPLIDGSRMFMEMLRIRWYDLTGKYDGESTLTAQTAKTLPERRRP